MTGEEIKRKEEATSKQNWIANQGFYVSTKCKNRCDSSLLMTEIAQGSVYDHRFRDEIKSKWVSGQFK